MKNTFWILCFLCIYACSDTAMEHRQGIDFKRYAEACEPHTEKYWLLDLTAYNASDSVFIDTRKLKRKAELKTEQINIHSGMFKLLQTVCKGDSMYMEMKADSFYGALNSSVPSFLKQGEMIRLNIIVHDRLDLADYIAYKRRFEAESIKKYIQKFSWNAVKDTASGIYYEILRSSEKTASPFEKIELGYVLKTIDDQLIAYSKEGDPLKFDRKDSTLMPGIRVLAPKLKEGEKLRAIVPSDYAYGEKGIEKVQPYQPIIVELEYLRKVE